MDKEMKDILLSLCDLMLSANKTLSEINCKLEKSNTSHTIDDIYEELETIKGSISEIKGDGLYNNISDIYEKLDIISNDVSSLNDQLGSSDYSVDINSINDSIKDAVNDLQGPGYMDLSDVCEKLDSVESAITTLSVDISTLGV